MDQILTHNFRKLIGDNTWVIGVILCLAGSISLNFG